MKSSAAAQSSSEGYSRVEFVSSSSRRGNAKANPNNNINNNKDIIDMGENLDIDE